MSEPIHGSLINAATEAIQKALDSVAIGDRVLSVMVEDVTDVSKAALPVSRPCVLRVAKADESGEERYVLGVVLEPDVVDSQGDTYSAETVRKSAHLFMEEYGDIGLQHAGLINDKVKILESWIQHEDTTINGDLIKAGTWMLAVRVQDDELWAKVKVGEITGFSIGGVATSTPVLT